jgi:hypothetical protein
MPREQDSKGELQYVCLIPNLPDDIPGIVSSSPAEERRRLADIRLGVAKGQAELRQLAQAILAANEERTGAPPRDQAPTGSACDDGLAVRAGGELPWESNPAWEDATAQQKRVLQYMHGRDSASVADFVEAVWGGDSAKDGAVRTALSRANALLLKMGNNRTLTRVRGEPVIRWA